MFRISFFENAEPSMPKCDTIKSKRRLVCERKKIEPRERSYTAF